MDEGPAGDGTEAATGPQAERRGLLVSKGWVQAVALVVLFARAHVCNACPAKPACTDSDDGRELVRSLDAWPRSEAGRFHRGISLALVVLAGLLPTVVLVRHHAPAEAALLVAVLVTSALVARSLVGELRAAPDEPRLTA